MSDPKPTIHQHDCLTGETIEREMTDEEYAELFASGWTEETNETPSPA